MGLLDKFKNMFTEEIEDEEPIKKEVIQVEIKAANKKEESVISLEKEDVTKNMESEKKEIPFSSKEAETFKEEKEPVSKDEKFSFPVFFDDEDFNTLDHAEPVRESRMESRKTKPYGGASFTSTEVEKEEVNGFRPTPVISPIYGVLDKNYKKEDITLRDENRETNKVVSVDDIRNKAYGTLEDELESSLLHEDMYDKPAVYRAEKDMFEEFEVINSLEDEQEEDFLDPAITIEEAEKISRVKKKKYEDEAQDESEDLFNLIDSMYKKGDE